MRARSSRMCVVLMYVAVVRTGSVKLTVTVAVFELTTAAIRAQYLVVVISGGVVKLLPVAPAIGSGKSDEPRYHWYVNTLPVAPTLRVAVPPYPMVWLCGCAVIVMSGPHPG